MGAPLRFEVQERVLTLTLDRPDRLNALVPEMSEGFHEALRRAAEPDVKALVLRGAGRGFCAGGDIAWMSSALAEGRWEEMHGLLDLGVHVAHALRVLPKPVLAGLQGPAAGAGMSLALAADLRIASADLKFSMAFVKIGLHPDWGGSVLLGQLVNPSIATELMLTGATLDAARAQALGLVNQVVPLESLDAAVQESAARLAAGPAEAFARIKASALRNLGQTPDSLMALLKAEGDQMKAAMRGAEAREGIASFLEKRPPVFG